MASFHDFDMMLLLLLPSDEVVLQFFSFLLLSNNLTECEVQLRPIYLVALMYRTTVSTSVFEFFTVVEFEDWLELMGLVDWHDLWLLFYPHLHFFLFKF